MTIDKAIAPRKWWLAGLLSLITPGLGQIYNGQIYKAIIFFFGPLLFIPPGIYILLYGFTTATLIIGLSVIFLYRVAIAADAIVVARRIQATYTAHRFNKWYIYIALLALALGFNSMMGNYIKSSYVQAFKLPSESMQPTLLVGDHVLVDKRASARDLQRGDLVVFRYPKDPTKDFMKRVLAIGGDKVEIRDKVLFVNDKLQNEPYVQYSDPDIIPRQRDPRDNFGPIIVPAQSYFVLSDNRDRGTDSRFYGVVNKMLVKGKLLTIYWSWDKTNRTVRWERIGVQFH
jgi:signal peptidase I